MYDIHTLVSYLCQLNYIVRMCIKLLITYLDNRKSTSTWYRSTSHFIHVLLLVIGNPPNPDNWEEVVVTPLTISAQPAEQNSSRLWRISSSCWHEIYPYQKMTGRSLARGEVIGMSPRKLMKCCWSLGAWTWIDFFFRSTKWNEGFKL